MLAKKPRNRFQRAADAAAALNSLGEPTVPGVASTRVRSAVETNTLLPTEMNTIHALDWNRAVESVDTQAEDRPAVTVSAVPETWQRPGAGNRRGVANAGLGLFGLRSIPMVDREGERTEMWSQFVACTTEHEPRCVLLHGPSGVGKSRLAEWLVRRAHELGCAEVLHATQTDQDRADGGLAQMLARFFETRGLEGDVVTNRVLAALAHHRYLSPLDAETFTIMISGGSPRGSQPLIMESNLDAQRFDAVARLLTHLASVRPVVVWVDDPRPEGDVARFVASALEGAVAGPVLFVLTHRSGADRPFPTYEAAEQNGRMKRLEIRPLSPTYVRALAATTLGLEPPLSDVVAANAGGMPLAAIQMIADWVERRDLVVGPAGYQLREGSAERGGMHTLTDVWVARLENTYRVAGFARDRGHHAMTIGALLGRRINFYAWSVATGFPEPELHALGRALKVAGLATASRRGILLAFENLRQALIDEQTDPERLRRNHLACAEALRRARDVDDDAMRLQQIARHFEQAGEHVEALSPMFDSIELYLERFETARAAELVRSAKAILDKMNAAGDSQQVLRAQLFEATIRYLEKQFDEAQDIARSCLERAEQAGHKELTARSLLSLSHAMFKSSIASMNERGDEAVSYGQRATDLFLELGMEQDASRAQLACAYALLQSGRAEPAAESAKLSAELASGDVLGGALAHYMLGTLERARGNDDEALERFEEAIELSLEGGVRLLLAGAYNGRGDILRFRGQHAEALRAYEDAVLLWENLGSTNVHTARMNAALANIAMGEYGAARATLMTILNHTQGTEKGYESVFAATFILPCLAAAAEHAMYDDYWVESTQSLAELGLVDRDVATTFELVARLWREHGDSERASAAVEMAEEQHEKLAEIVT
jgi:tetratricopeptide (TPR) repeat protein